MPMKSARRAVPLEGFERRCARELGSSGSLEKVNQQRAMMISRAGTKEEGHPKSRVRRYRLSGCVRYRTHADVR